jgi:hypothetical protein
MHRSFVGAGQSNKVDRRRSQYYAWFSSAFVALHCNHQRSRIVHDESEQQESSSGRFHSIVESHFVNLELQSAVFDIQRLHQVRSRPVQIV